VKILNFKSKKKNNPFALEWSYHIANTHLNIDNKELTKFLLSRVPELMKIKPGRDGYTGLNSNSTTARHSKYNLLNWESLELDQLKEGILKAHHEFLRHLKLSVPKKLYIKCWYNVMKKGERIKPHMHSIFPDAYLGGHYCVKTNNTSTYYMTSPNHLNEPEVHQSKNTPGQLTLFQQCIPHYTDEAKDQRITIAFDLSLNKINDTFIRL
tara:strand:- start:68 stop:697 length:630 start_codon:yes stop_codon:yes gene_type:complete